MKPSVPSEYLSRQELGIYSSRKELNDSSGIYGTGSSYRRTSTQNQQNEYSGFDTLDRRNATALIQQLSSGHNSIGPFAGRDINNLIRTNLENVDYGTTNSIIPSQMMQYGAHSQQPAGPNSTNNKANNQIKTDADRRTSNVSQRSTKSSASQYYESPTNNRNPVINYEDNGNIYIDPYVDSHDVVPNWVPIERCIEKVITTYDYDGLRDDELTFKENTYIYVIKKNDDHWYEGILQDENGQIHTGLYPYNYAKCVQKYQPDHSEC